MVLDPENTRINLLEHYGNPESHAKILSEVSQWLGPTNSATLAAANLADEAGTDVSRELFFKGFDKLTEVCDAIEIFPTITKKSIEVLSKSQRVIKTIISRAGSIVAHYIQTSGQENPFFTDFDWFLEQRALSSQTLRNRPLQHCKLI